MHILMLNYEYPPLGGGGGVATQVLVQALAQRGVQVTVVTSGEAQTIQTEQPIPFLQVIRLPVTSRNSRSVASLSSLFSYIKQVKRWSKSISEPHFDLVHSQFAVPTGIAGKWVASKWKLPHVVTVHGFDIYDPTRWLSAHRCAPVRWVVQRVLNSAQRITTQSKDIEQRLRSGFLLPVPPVIIPLGIPWVERPLHPSVDSTTFTMIGVGRLVARKGFSTAIQALPLLPPSVHLTLVGDGPEKPNLQQLAQQLQVENRVHFPGAIFDQEKWKLLAAAQVYVLPSLHEGFSLATVEALMMGLPVIASNIGGQTDYLVADQNALFIPPQHPKALAEAVKQLITDQPLLLNMAAQNLTLAKQYTDQIMTDHYQHLYEDLLR